jgi:hypothetical protein
VLAERQRWPAEAVEECERIDRLAPGWWTTYRPASDHSGVPMPAGYYALREREHGRQRPAYGTQPDELLAKIRAWPT